MQIIQKSGLFIFLLGFGIFLASFFFENYTLSENIINDKLEANEASKVLKIEIQSMIGKEYSSSFTFLKDLKSTFKKVNEIQIEKYAISDEKIELIAQMIGDSGSEFSLNDTGNLFNAENPNEAYQWASFQSYGSWLDGREFSSGQELSDQLKGVRDNIVSYGIVNEKGFDKYKVKNLEYEITKASSQGAVSSNQVLFLLLTYLMCIVGAVMYLLPKVKLEGAAGVKNNGIFHSAMKNRGWLGIFTGTFLIAFYVFLYFYPEYMTAWIITVDPVSIFLKGSEAGRFFLYGFLYTLTILVMGVRMIIKYRHSKYQILRTASVMFFQTSFAFLIPEILLRLNQPYFDFKNIWPLDYDFFFDNELNTLIANGGLGMFMLSWGIALVLIGVPVFVYFFGKRWYCSWVCGCGGLAETLGDPYRQLSDKSLKAWKFERISIHAVLAFAVVMTVAVLYTFWTGESQLLGLNTYSIRSVYGAWIGAGFAGVIGTGFYPLMGNRVWCRFGCPLAAYLGLVQRFKSRFRITTNGGQCISCGNCSTHCEMGIDVRWYAQRGQNIVRSSCVGCGVCSSVCPRGVLNLENRDEKGRFNESILIGNDSIAIEQ
ncbi:4Fe-4S dicluster domain-containing protein [Reichenbachiella sp. MALMAid0571]|uniref:4Fe-4S binding protein n=1 Tax=Reichenbachiella sp. MALMAid0571 TaxID=3143939 RepID=UPI0032DF27CF